MVNNSAHFFRIMEKKTENWNEIMICLCFCYGNMTDTRYECEILSLHIHDWHEIWMWRLKISFFHNFDRFVVFFKFNCNVLENSSSSKIKSLSRSVDHINGIFWKWPKYKINVKSTTQIHWLVNLIVKLCNYSKTIKTLNPW